MQKKNKTFAYLSLLVLGMFCFSFVMIPFYNVLCKKLGFNGKTNSTAAVNTTLPTLGRKITIEFLSSVDTKLPVHFYPKQTKIEVTPGENIQIFYIAKNETNHTIVTQSVPSITPSQAAAYFKKMDCFCFKKQILAPKQTLEMPVKFFIDPKMPNNIHELTLSYMMFGVNQ